VVKHLFAFLGRFYKYIIFGKSTISIDFLLKSKFKIRLFPIRRWSQFSRIFKNFFEQRIILISERSTEKIFKTSNKLTIRFVSYI
jgi:hypothetical protein